MNDEYSVCVYAEFEKECPDCNKKTLHQERYLALFDTDNDIIDTLSSWIECQECGCELDV